MSYEDSLGNVISRNSAAALTTADVPVVIDSNNKVAAATAGGPEDGTLVTTSATSGTELSFKIDGADARQVLLSGTATAGLEAKVGTSGYENAANGDVAVGRFLTSGSAAGTALMLPYARSQSYKGGKKIAYLALAGGAGSSGVFAAWQNPEGARIIVTRAILDITTQSSGASTLDVGVTATSATTSVDTLLDGVSGAAVAVFDSMDPALDSGANAHAQSLASGKWVTVAEATGDVTALVGTLRIEYYVAA